MFSLLYYSFSLSCSLITSNSLNLSLLFERKLPPLLILFNFIYGVFNAGNPSDYYEEEIFIADFAYLFLPFLISFYINWSAIALANSYGLLKLGNLARELVKKLLNALLSRLSFTLYIISQFSDWIVLLSKNCIMITWYKIQINLRCISISPC